MIHINAKKILILLLCLLAPFLYDWTLGFFSVNRILGDLQELDNVHDSDDRLGWIPKPNSIGRHQANGIFNASYEMDENGYKKIENPSEPKLSIYFFGDSFTFGHGVTNQDTFTNIIADQYLQDNIAVYNLGVMGYGVTQMYIRFLDVEARLKPNDLVIFSPTSHDLVRDVDSFNFLASLLFSNRAAPFKNFPVFENDVIHYVQFNTFINRFRLILLSSPLTSRLILGLTPDSLRVKQNQKNREMNKRMMQLIKEKTEKRGSRFFIFFLPYRKELIQQKYHTDVSYLTPINMIPLFPSSPQEINSRFLPDDHLNAVGNATAAKVIVNLLIENKLLDSSDFKKLPS